MTREAYERNEGIARRRAADLARRLAIDPAYGNMTDCRSYFSP